MIAVLLQNTFGRTSNAVQGFLKRALIFLVCWMVLYHLIMVPNQLGNEWLTLVTGKVTTSILNLFYGGGFSWFKPDVSCVQVFMGKYKVLSIADPCNALELYVLYTAFIFCLATSLPRQLTFTIGGIAAILLLNVLRCAAIAWLNMNRPDWVDFAHHYAFTFLMYGFIFLGWMLYMKNYESKIKV